MTVLFDHPSPFLLAHGGVQVQIEETKVALGKAGIDVEYLRWWDPRQGGDLIHYFGAPSCAYLHMARRKGLPVVLTSFFSATCNRSERTLFLQGLLTRGLLSIPLGDSIKDKMRWRSFREASHVVVGLEAERDVLKRVYGLPDSRISVVPLGVDEVFPNGQHAADDQKSLITVGTICAVKRSVELAMLARETAVPIIFVGDPFSQTDPYWRQFEALIDGHFVQYREHVDDKTEMAALMCSARGFVLLSRYENWSLAAHEAAACGLPLLLPDMKWSRECFGDQVTYFSRQDAESAAANLKRFYLSAASLPSPLVKHYPWSEIALRLREIYSNVGQLKAP